MAYENDILTRNDNDELSVRVVQSVGDNPAASYDDVYTRDDNGKLAVRVVGSGGGDVDTTKVVNKADVLPTANSGNAGKVYMYSGATDSNYTHGYIYECQASTVYTDTVTFEPATISGTVVTASANALAGLCAEYIQGDITSIVSGTMTYDEAGGLWVFVGKDSEDTTVGTFQLYTQDFEDAGFTFTGTPEDGDVVAFACTITESASYAWVRIDVQPEAKLGRYLSSWNCATGLAGANPPESPYEYSTGDYFIVGTVAGSGGTNYKPNGSSYVTGQASTTVETNAVAVNDTYLYDGTNWTLLKTGSAVTSVNGQTGDVTVQATLVSGTNIKTIDGNSVLGSGNLELSTYLTYPAGWTTNGTTKAFCDDIAADSSAVKGKAYLGEVTFSDLPASMVNGEIVVEIMDGTTAANKVIVLSLKSGNVAPYAWQYVYWDNGTNTSGWLNIGQQVQSDWNQSDNTAVDYIKNKPTIPAAQVNADWNANSGVAEILNKPSLATVATSGSYTDLTNTPTIPAAQVNSDWNASSGVAEILNKPTLAAVATSGSYSDLSNTPTIPDAIQVSSMPTAAAGELGKVYQYIGTTDANYTHGYFYECVSDGATPPVYSWSNVQVQASSGGLPSQTGNSGKFLTTDGTDASWSDKPLVNNTVVQSSLAIGSGSSTYNTNTVVVGQNVSGGESSVLIGAGIGTISAGNNVAIGYSAKPNAQQQVVIGSQASSSGGGQGKTIIGRSAKAGTGAGNVAIGWEAQAGIATSGDEFSINRQIAIGSGAQTNAKSAIQLGKGTNSEAGTLCIGSYYNSADVNYKLLDADGTIPTDRYTTTPSADGTYVPTLTISSGVATRSWAAPSGGAPTTATATLAVADWSSNTQTVTVQGVTASNTVFVAPAPASNADFVAAGIVCTAQASDSLTFTCTTTPSSAITVNVCIFG